MRSTILLVEEHNAMPSRQPYMLERSLKRFHHECMMPLVSYSMQLVPFLFVLTPAPHAATTRTGTRQSSCMKIRTLLSFLHKRCLSLLGDLTDNPEVKSLPL